MKRKWFDYVVVCEFNISSISLLKTKCQRKSSKQLRQVIASILFQSFLSVTSRVPDLKNHVNFLQPNMASGMEADYDL